MKIIFSKFITLFILINAAIFSQDSILIEVGDLKVTADEFRNRFELIPQLNTGRGDDPEIMKHDFLYSLIAEKLWALEAEKLGLDSSDIMKTAYKVVEKMYVRDALYNIEIKNKINVNNEELQEGLQRILTRLKLDIFLSPDQNEIYRIYNLLEEGASFDSLYSFSENKIPPIEVEYGEMQKPVEDMLYQLNEGEYTEPIKASSGWFIFCLSGKEPLPSEGVSETISKVERIIKDKKTDSLYNAFLNDFLIGKKVEANGTIFWSIADKITFILNKRKSEEDIQDDQFVNLDGSDILKIETELSSDTLNMPFINFEEIPLTAKEFLRYFIFEGFYTDTVEPKVIAAKLNSRVRTLIEQELLAKEGYRRGLHNLPEVQNFIKMWRENYLSKVLQTKLADSSRVSDDEVYEYYLKLNDLENTGRLEVNILEILTDSLEVIETILNELESGADFHELASIHTKRKWTKDNGGEFGLFPETMYGDIGRTAAKMEVGDVYGPLKTPEGYSIFKLIDKKETGIDSIGSFDDIKADLKKELAYKKLSTNFIDYTVNLANKYGVNINENLFGKLQVNDWKMFTYRYMGFGGRITAVPIVFPFYEWVEPWKKSLKELP